MNINEQNNAFKLCPMCGEPTVTYVDNRKWKCYSCNFTLYNNVASAIGLIIIFDAKTMSGNNALKAHDEGYY
ncbi:MAG: NUDIX hydrolase, partial [Spirochaetales bacterium]